MNGVSEAVAVAADKKNFEDHRYPHFMAKNVRAPQSSTTTFFIARNGPSHN